MTWTKLSTYAHFMLRQQEALWSRSNYPYFIDSETEAKLLSGRARTCTHDSLIIKFMVSWLFCALCLERRWISQTRPWHLAYEREAPGLVTQSGACPSGGVCKALFIPAHHALELHGDSLAQSQGHLQEREPWAGKTLGPKSVEHSLWQKKILFPSRFPRLLTHRQLSPSSLPPWDTPPHLPTPTLIGCHLGHRGVHWLWPTNSSSPNGLAGLELIFYCNCPECRFFFFFF